MNNDETDRSKVEKPHGHFDAPHEIVADPGLSKNEKIQALNSLEQDARQLAIAAAEGMSGGEDTKLQEVLHAKDALELPPIISAYEVVLRDLHIRRVDAESSEKKRLIEQAIEVLEAIKNAS